MNKLHVCCKQAYNVLCLCPLHENGNETEKVDTLMSIHLTVT